MAGTAVSAPAAAAHAPAIPSGRTGYRNLADYQADMVTLAVRHPSLVAPITLPHRTTQGRPVTGVEITADTRRPDGKPVLLITGMHHGNEPASGELTLEFGFDLAANYGTDERITDLLNKVRVVLVPVVNVDGLVHGTRHTAADVGLNRNYGFGWSPREPYPGSGPWSEPETRNVRDLISSRQVTTFLTLHTCLSTMLYPPLQRAAGPPQDIAAFRAFADAMGAQNGYSHPSSADDYETAGEAIDWSYYTTRGQGQPRRLPGRDGAGRRPFGARDHHRRGPAGRDPGDTQGVRHVDRPGGSSHAVPPAPHLDHGGRPTRRRLRLGPQPVSTSRTALPGRRHPRRADPLPPRVLDAHLRPAGRHRAPDGLKVQVGRGHSAPVDLTTCRQDFTPRSARSAA
jgi:zinc carboxypeptidase